MKEKIIIFLLGLLCGAIISTGSIYVYTLANNDNKMQPEGMGQNMMKNDNGNNPPEIPNDNNFN